MKLISIEGNIGSGKSTLIELLKGSGLNCIFIPEPVNVWNEVKDLSGVGILERYYQDSERYAFPFQMMAYITRLSIINKTVKEFPDSVIITERSIHTDREVFAKMLYDSGKINHIEYTIYLKWFDELSTVPLDAIIYLKVSPEICKEHIMKRNRQGEEEIQLSYLENCHNYHEVWINGHPDVLYLENNNQISIDKIKSFVENYLKK
jgi:deoxyadenosine/deoxycytidine kinase